MRVMVCGSRDWTDGGLIRRELSSLQGVDVIIEGEAPGSVSSCGRDLARDPIPRSFGLPG